MKSFSGLVRPLLQREPRSMAENKNPPKPSNPHPKSHLPMLGNYDSSHTTIGGGVAIFHLASDRVVLCYQPSTRAWFLPKGRRDANEDSASGAEREGFEESGYRNRLLPLPIVSRQPKPYHPSQHAQLSPFVTEPVWTQLAPVTPTVQYILFWYIAETLPPALETELTRATDEQGGAYQYPPKFDVGMTLKERVTLEGNGSYEPVKHEGTGVDEEENSYVSRLVPVQEALTKLKGSVQADVILRGWEAICERRKIERLEQAT